MSIFGGLKDFLESVDEKANKTSETIATVTVANAVVPSVPFHNNSLNNPAALPNSTVTTAQTEIITELRVTVDQLLQDKEQLRHELKEAETQITLLQQRQVQALKESQTAKVQLTEKQQELTHVAYLLSLRESAMQELKTELEQYKQRCKVFLEKPLTTSALTPIVTNHVPSEELHALETKCEDSMVRLERETFAHNQTKSNLELLRVTMQELKSHYTKELAKSEETIQRQQEDISALKQQYEMEVQNHFGTKAELAKARRLVGAPSTTNSGVTPTKALAPMPDTESQSVSTLLLDVQTALEKKRTECDSLQHRLSLCMTKLKDAEVKYSSLLTSKASGGIGGSGGMNTNAGSTEIDMPQLPLEVESRFFEDLSQRGWIGQRATKVASSLNFLSLTAGRYLRGNTQLRVGIMVYVIILHVWVFFALSVAPVLHHKNV